jgi:tyrosyl-tRNA synthetase
VLDVARRFYVTRIKKCCQIMGRKEGSLTTVQVLYLLMQCADVFFLKADICQLGVNQHKVNMLARKYCHHTTKDRKRMHKPIILSHHMLYNLKEGQEMMSKSNPDSAEFMEDSAEDVERKIRSVYCPTAPAAAVPAPATAPDVGRKSMHLAKDNDNAALKNPILDYVHCIVLSSPGSTLACYRHHVAVNNGGTTDATTTSTTMAGEGGGQG